MSNVPVTQSAHHLIDMGVMVMQVGDIVEVKSFSGDYGYISRIVDENCLVRFFIVDILDMEPEWWQKKELVPIATTFRVTHIIEIGYYKIPIMILDDVGYTWTNWQRHEDPSFNVCLRTFEGKPYTGTIKCL